MQTALADYSGLDAMHVISHGAPGTLYLGSTVLDSENLSANEGQLQAIGKRLTEAGDLLLYGRHVGQGQTGNAFINALAVVTAVDVAASNDVTRATALGGNWAIEQVAGNIETEALSSDDFSGLLQANAAPVFKEKLIF